MDDISTEMTTLKSDLESNEQFYEDDKETIVDLTEIDVFKTAVVNRDYAIVFAFARQMRLG